MKIHIWIRKEEAISGNITKYYNMPPQSTDWPNYVEVSVSQDEFAELEDRDLNNSRELTVSKEETITFSESDWLVEQYNRNRLQKDWIKHRDEIPYIYERNGEEVYRRRVGDTERELMTNDEFHSSKKPIKKDLKKLLKELQSISGAKFADWWKGLTKEEQIQLTKFWE